MSASACTESGAGGQQGSDADAAAAVERAQQFLDVVDGQVFKGPSAGEVKVSDVRAPDSSDFNITTMTDDLRAMKIALVGASADNVSLHHQLDLAAGYLDALGVANETFFGDFTAAGLQRAMTNAIAARPDAMILTGVSPDSVGPQLAQARAAGIKVVHASSTRDYSPGDIDAYVPESSNLSQAAVAADMIVRSEGRANIVWITYPQLKELEIEAGIDFITQNCPDTCKVEEKPAADQLFTPLGISGLVTSLVRANPSLDYVALPTACQFASAASSAARQLGTVVIEAAGCGSIAVSAMNGNDIPVATGIIEPWKMLQAIDQAFRLLKGEEPLPENAIGAGSYFLDPANTPDRSTDATYGPIDRWAVSQYDFVAPYSEAWNVELGGVIAQEK